MSRDARAASATRGTQRTRLFVRLVRADGGITRKLVLLVPYVPRFFANLDLKPPEKFTSGSLDNINVQSKGDRFYASRCL